MKRSMPIGVALGLLLAAVPLAAQTPSLDELSLQDLLAVEVTSVARKEQTIARTAAAVYVITADDIRRSGATTLPDVLRMAPGFSVSQLNAGAWSVTSRGFGGLYANKLLVLIDGRSVYSPITGGIDWDMQLVPLDTIEQVEVIRGPGGSLWGANAVNGVINIITKRADATQGGRVGVVTSTYEPGTTDLSYGSRLGSVYSVTRARYVQRRTPGEQAGFDDADGAESFFARQRFDWGQRGVNRFSLDGSVQGGTLRLVASTPTFTPPFADEHVRVTDTRSGHLRFAWDHTHNSRAETSLQAYYSGGSRINSFSGNRWHSLDLDIRHRRALGSRHDVVSGVQYRYTLLHDVPSIYSWRSDGDEPARLATGFVQDEIALGRAVRVIPGVKLEHNGDTGLEAQPSLRALWMPTPSQSVWAAASRAVRTPNRQDLGMHLAVAVIPAPTPLPLVLTVDGNPAIRSEVAKAYEVGYRFSRPRFSVDVTAYVTRYADLVASVEGEPEPGFELGRAVLRLPIRFVNADTVKGNGTEVAISWLPRDWWQIAGSYTLVDVDKEDAFTDSPNNGAVAPHQFHARTSFELGHGVEASALFYHVSEFAEVGVDAYNRFDARLAWSGRRIELAAGARNLLRREAPEYRDLVSHVEAAAIRRSLFGTVAVKF
ncbi:MAG: TonB-dependent receptor plug domain-containing protein [Vicinamibacterales bacterium]